MRMEYGSDVTFFYLLPGLLVAWFPDGISVALMSIFCTLTWFAANVMSERIYACSSFSLWYFLAFWVFSHIRVFSGIHPTKFVEIGRRSGDCPGQAMRGFDKMQFCAIIQNGAIDACASQGVI
jgi:hypothetical protein